jgi:hypothetical protein
VRSYWWVDCMYGDVGTRYFSINSFWGRTMLGALPDTRGHGMQRDSYEVGVTIAAPQKVENSGFVLSNVDGQLVIAFPHWFLATVFGFAAVLSWLPPRFTTRTLLIATTLIGAVLGLTVWAVR